MKECFTPTITKLIVCLCIIIPITGMAYGVFTGKLSPVQPTNNNLTIATEKAFAPADTGYEQIIKNIKTVFDGYVKYKETTDSKANKDLMRKSLESLGVVTNQKDLIILINVWMYYDPTDFPSRQLVYAILERNKLESIKAVNKRLDHKIKGETDETVPYVELNNLLKKLES
ncbi:MAG: hypothetical protein V4538_09020 [Bacteroidota bacterium]